VLFKVDFRNFVPVRSPVWQGRSIAFPRREIVTATRRWTRSAAHRSEIRPSVSIEIPSLGTLRHSSLSLPPSSPPPPLPGADRIAWFTRLQRGLDFRWLTSPRLINVNRRRGDISAHRARRKNRRTSRQCGTVRNVEYSRDERSQKDRRSGAAS